MIDKNSINNLSHIDYKDVDLLKQFLTPHGKITARKRTGVHVKTQRKISSAIKRARFMGLIPYTII
jgi:small subunit ribosomal protein S18